MSAQIEKAVALAHQQHDVYLASFLDLLRIPSISSDATFSADVQRAADWLVSEMTRIGLDNAQAIPTDGQPMVYGDWLHAGADKPTILIYAHYDVQPVEPQSAWEFPPFVGDVVDGKIRARGAMDDKCGVMINLKAFEAMLTANGTLPINVKVIFEGEEESGSPSMLAAIAANRDLLQADLIVISDGGNAPDQPFIITSVRGIVDGEVTVRGPAQDLHSGKFGGIVHNPVHMVGKMIAALHDDAGRVQIPGFYDDVVGANSAEKAAFAHAETDFITFQQDIAGVNTFWGDSTYSFLERIATQPTCDVNGVYGGYAGDGMMTIIPASAGFKLSLRLVADMDPADIEKKVTDFINSFATSTLDITVDMHAGCFAARCVSDGPIVDALTKAYEAVWKQAPVTLGMGGSVPIMGMFYSELGIPMTMFGFGIGDGQHAANEYLNLREFQRGIDTAIHFYHNLADAP